MQTLTLPPAGWGGGDGLWGVSSINPSCGQNHTRVLLPRCLHSLGSLVCFLILVLEISVLRTSGDIDRQRGNDGKIVERWTDGRKQS